MLMFIVANIVGSTIQITTLPLPVLSTLQASGLVFNSICASIILKEPFTRYSFIGTLLVAIGALLIALFGAIAEPSHNLDQLLLLLGRKHFLGWLFSTLFVVVLLVVANWVLKRIYPRNTARLRLVRGMFFGCVSGILSAHSLLIAKSAVELLVRTIVDRHNQFDRWQSWLILVGLVVFALTQLYYMHRGLKLVSTSVLYPLVFCIYNIIAIIDGLIYFHQSDRLSGLHAGLIALGTVILLAGVVCLSWRLEDAEDEPASPAATKHTGRVCHAYYEVLKLWLIDRHLQVQMPQTVLQPGIGLAHGHILDESESSSDIESDAPGLIGNSKRRALDERTPLLQRAPHGSTLSGTQKRPTLDARHSSERMSLTPRRAPTRRRMTASEETDEIWAELNDRGSVARRSTDLERRPRSGTLPTRRKDPQAAWLNQRRRRSWFDSISGSPRGRSVSHGKQPADPDDGEQSDTDCIEGTAQRSGTWGFGQRGGEGEDVRSDWFKLKWWRKRWRDGEEEELINEDDSCRP
jgi:drug/metabolite transporter (DMT)-like permease